ncbi:MAG: alpha-E domain-containing protein [Chitinophagaceae bacterium]|nr:MAG: alpha-E domain-containing protein [Chitinophagaceae bacterium]
MLSRVADSLYWMTRYMERSDGILRMLKVNYASSQDEGKDFSWKPVLRLFSSLTEQDTCTMEKNTRAAIQHMVIGKENHNSVLNIVIRARENARSVQDHITKELWQVLNDFYHTIKDPKLEAMLRTDDPITVIDNLIRHGLLYYATSDITMARGEGYAFMNIGRLLERAIQSADIVDVKFSDLTQNSFGKVSDITYWKYLLMSISAYELYIKTYRGGFEPKNVVEMIILNKNFPRSVIYSLDNIHRYFERFRNEKNQESFQKMDFMIGKLKSKILYSTPDTIMEQNLHEYLLDIKTDLHKIANGLNHHYFAYA